MAYTMGSRRCSWSSVRLNRRGCTLLRAGQRESAFSTRTSLKAEDVQVQLATSHTASFPCPTEANGSQSIASQIVTTLSKIETNYQLELNDVYGDLGDKAFRS